jgi:signal transduction histidine kinase
VRVEIEAVGGSVRVRVLDEGAGLAPEVAARVFEPGVTTKTRGSGLGLTIARGLARQHGGELSLGAREGGGATAELTVPLEGPEPGQGVPA